MTKSEYERAKQADTSARQAGRPVSACPLYAMGKDGELLREAWRAGWDEENERRAK